jgi:hypothetical protein
MLMCIDFFNKNIENCVLKLIGFFLIFYMTYSYTNAQSTLILPHYKLKLTYL